MSEIIVALEVNFRYTKQFIPDNDNITEALTKPIFPDEANAYDLIIHALTPMYKRAHEDLHSQSDLENIELPLKMDLSVRERIIEAYEKTLELFTKAQGNFVEEMNTIVNEEYQQTRSKQYTTAGMHAIHHIGQAISICNINLRKNEK